MPYSRLNASSNLATVPASAAVTNRGGSTGGRLISASVADHRSAGHPSRCLAMPACRAFRVSGDHGPDARGGAKAGLACAVTGREQKRARVNSQRLRLLLVRDWGTVRGARRRRLGPVLRASSGAALAAVVVIDGVPGLRHGRPPDGTAGAEPPHRAFGAAGGRVMTAGLRAGFARVSPSSGRTRRRSTRRPPR